MNPCFRVLHLTYIKDQASNHHPPLPSESPLMLTLHFDCDRQTLTDFITQRPKSIRYRLRELRELEPRNLFSLFSEDGPGRRRLRVPGGVPADVPERRDHVQERLRVLQRRRLKKSMDS